MAATLYVCDTCSYTQTEKYIGTQTGGEALCEQLVKAAKDNPDVIVKPFSCLMSCQKHCSVALAAKGKINYVLGGFSPTQEHAQAILEYAAHYNGSETGQVPYKDWPQDIKGKFTCRIPAIAE